MIPENCFKFLKRELIDCVIIKQTKNCPLVIIKKHITALTEVSKIW